MTTSHLLGAKMTLCDESSFFFPPNTELSIQISVWSFVLEEDVIISVSQTQLAAGEAFSLPTKPALQHYPLVLLLAALL